MIEPVSEDLARAKKVPGGGGGQQVTFVKVDLGVGVGMGPVVARELALRPLRCLAFS